MSSKIGVQEAKKDVAREVSEENNARDEVSSSGSNEFGDCFMIT